LQDTLSQLFELEKTSVYAIISKMIINEELMASLDEPTQCMVMHRSEPSRLQSLSMQLADKVCQLVENNERMLEFRSGWGGDRGGQGGRWGDKDRDGQRGDRDGQRGEGRGGRGGGFGGRFGGDRDRYNDRGGRFNDRGDRGSRFNDRGDRGGRFNSGRGERGGGRFGGDRGGRFNDRR